ncbi:MAG: M50 family metallopeptidase [Candidatus Curtissbacteria bacterium]|nr:M50 family metallopeptidase [Candidatus Curtissbacteria bacterium]
MLAIIIFILILSFLVLIHEFGHFVMAKRGGIGVEEFGFGLPPRIWGKKHKGTLYSVNWLPFGGFVRLVGEDSLDKKKDAKNSFQVKSLGRRMVVVLAGVFINFVVAVIIFYVVLFTLGFKVTLPVVTDYKFRFVNQSTQVVVVPLDGWPAAGAGIKAGDTITAANDTAIKSAQDLQNVIRKNATKPIVFTLTDFTSNQRRQVTVTPKYDEKLKAPAIGVGIDEFVELNYQTLPQKLFAGFAHSYNLTDYSFRYLGKVIGYSVAHRDFSGVSQNVSGPVGIAQITAQAVAFGPISVLQVVGLLSLNLAVMNALPIPALDGGRFFFLVIEAILRRKPHPAIEKWTHTIGFAVLIGLIVLITYNDILKIIK